MTRTKYKGKFIKKVKLNRIIKAVQRMNKAKIGKRNWKLVREAEEARNLIHDESDEAQKIQENTCMKKGICEGNRVIDLRTLPENLQCEKCGELLHLKNTKHETINGASVDLMVTCSSCTTMKQVHTTDSHVSHNTEKFHNDTNTRLVLGAVHAGIGCTALNKLLVCLNSPTIYPALYKKYEHEVGPAIEEAAKESCKEAAIEEKRLVIDNINQLCDDLPEEVVKEVYLELSKMTYGSNSTSTDGNNNHEKFDAALGQIVNIIVSYDMGWSKRGAGRSYDSLNGYGAIIGFLSEKIISFGTRNRKCRQCDKNVTKNHDCRKNFVGSAKAMEADLGAALVNNNSILQEAKINVRVLH